MIDDPKPDPRAAARAPARLACAAICIAVPWARSAVAQDYGDPEKGLRFAQRICAECHAVLPTQPISPLPRIATFKTIANTPGLTGTALAVWLQSPHPTMPNLVLSREDGADVIAYIVSLRQNK